MKIFKILLITFTLFVIVFFSLNIKLRILDSKNIFFKNFNFQGIECIDNEIYIISNFDSKIYKLNKKLELEEFFDTTLLYKNRFIFSHITSFYIRDNIFYGVNSMDKINGVLVKVSVFEIENNKKLSNSAYEIIRLDSNINHIEYHSNENEILVSHHYSSQRKKNLLKIEVNGVKCDIENKLKIQNMYFEKKTKKLYIISNLISYHIGIIYKLPIDNLCNMQNINFFNIKNKEIVIFPFYEMEGYTICNDKEFFVYINNNDSYIYIK